MVGILVTISNWFLSNLLLPLGLQKAKKPINQWMVKRAEPEITKKYLNKVRVFREAERIREEELGPDPKFIPPPLRQRKARVDEPSRATKEDADNWRNFRVQEFLSSSHKRFTLVADSGMGKTTFLKELAFEIAKGEMETTLLPCYFHLKELAGSSHTNDLKGKIRDTFKDIDHPQLNELIDHLFEEGRFIFLLDGLDQTTNQDNLASLLKMNKELLGNNHVIVAGRRWVYDRFNTETGFSQDYQYIEIPGFNTRQIKEYLGQDCYAVAASMVSRELLMVPILLHNIKLLHQNKELSRINTRTELYDKIVNFLLKREIDLGKHLPGVTITKTRFEILSYHTISKGHMGRFPHKEVFPELTEHLQISPDDDFPTLTQLGIMYEIWEGEIEKDIVFRHQSFQEYFASCELKKRLFPNGDVGALNLTPLLEHLEYKRWDEVIFFLIGSLEPAAAREIISFISRYDFFLVGKCIAQYKGNKDEDFKEIIDGLFEKIRDDSDAQEALAKIGTEGIITRLVDLLEGNDAGVRRAAAYALGSIGSESAVPLIRPLLEDNDASVRMATAYALGDIGSESAVPLIRPLLKDENSYVRMAAAYALGSIGSESAVPLIRPLLKDANASVRREAADALGRIGSESAVTLIRPLLKDDVADVRGAAADALGSIGSERAVSHLLPLLKDEDKAVRCSAAEALGRIGSERAVEHLLPLLKDEDYHVRSAAAYALGRIGSESAVPLIIPLLEDKEWYVYREAASALGRIGSESAVLPLIPLIEDNDVDVRRAAAYALGRIGSESAVPLIRPLLEDNVASVREAAAYALGRIDSESAVPLIRPLLEDNDVDVRWAAADAMVRCSKKLTEKDLLKLVERLYEEGHDEAVEEIKEVHNRRFLRLLHPELSR